MPSSGCQKCARSEEHTSELQSHDNLVCRLLLEKKSKSPSPRALAHRPVAAVSTCSCSPATTPPGGRRQWPLPPGTQCDLRVRPIFFVFKSGEPDQPAPFPSPIRLPA